MRSGLTIALLLSLLSVVPGAAVAEESLRDQLEAWWKQTQVGKHARKGCARSEHGCAKPVIARSRNGREAAMAPPEAEHGRVTHVRRASSGKDVEAAGQAAPAADMSIAEAPKPRRAAKRGRHLAANARAEAGAGPVAREDGPRRDRPGRYFLHGPRF